MTPAEQLEPAEALTVESGPAREPSEEAAEDDEAAEGGEAAEEGPSPVAAGAARTEPFRAGDCVRLLDRAPVELIIDSVRAAMASLPASLAHAERELALSARGQSAARGALVPLLLPIGSLRVGALAIAGGEVRRQISYAQRRRVPYSAVTLDVRLVDRAAIISRLTEWS